MKKQAALITLFSLLSIGAALAQDKPGDKPALELGIIASYTDFSQRENIRGYGYGFRGTRDFNRWLALELQSVVNPRAGHHADPIQFSLGPKFTLVNGVGKSSFLKKIDLFAYSRVGAFRLRPVGGRLLQNYTTAVEMGGGFQYYLNKRFALRFDIGDYLIWERGKHGRDHNFDSKASFVIRFK